MDLLTELALNMLAAESRKRTHVRQARQAPGSHAKRLFISLFAQLARGFKRAPQSQATETTMMPPTTIETGR
jgi:hypothetical protein